MSSSDMQGGTSLLTRAVQIYVSAMRVAAGTLMAIIVAVMVAQVVARYGFNASLIWAEELCRYLLIWMTFLLLGLAYENGQFVSLDVVPLMLPPRWRHALRIMMALPVLCFLAIMTWYGWDYASRFTNQTIPAMDFIFDNLFGRPAGLSVRLVYISVSVGCFLLSLHILVDVIRSVRAFMRNDPEAEADPAAGEKL